MTDTEVAAQANTIKAEGNEIQRQYNTGYLNLMEMQTWETLRHNEATEALETRKADITQAFNQRSLDLQQEKLNKETRLAEIEQNLKYANEETKRQLEKQANDIQARLADITKEAEDNKKWYNEQYIGLQQENQAITSRYNEALLVIDEMKANNQLFVAQVDAAYKRAEVMLAQMEQERKEDQMFWSNIWSAKDAALKRDELYALDRYREAEIKNAQQRNTNDLITSVVGAIGNVLSGLARGLPYAQLKDQIKRNTVDAQLKRLFGGN